jgi:site-specific DNA-methyltransferase (adenine-specific)
MAGDLIERLSPFYDAGGIKLYNCDCRAVEVASDLIVTDPPYGQSFISGMSGAKWGMLFNDDQPEIVEDCLAHALKGLRRHRHVYIFSGRLDLSKLPLSGITELIWDKEIIGMGDLTQPWGLQHEKIIFACHEFSKANREKGKGNLSARLRKGSVLRSQRAQSGAMHHPTEKPVDILRQMIESSSVMGEVVYDPFAGSGSTLIAAMLEGRQGVGCEIDERYCEIAAKRFDAISRGGLAV